MAARIILPTRRNRDVGILLLFLAGVFFFIAPPLARQFGLNPGITVWWSSGLGFLLLAIGFPLVFLARKTISVENGSLVVRDGFFTPILRFPHGANPTYKLIGSEEDLEGAPKEIWTVHLFDGEKQFLIDRREGQQLACRALAERLAKATAGSLVEVHEGKSLEFETHELDLSFRDRVRRYPQLLGKAVHQPDSTALRLTKESDRLIFGWSFLTAALFFEVFLVVAMLFGFAFLPLPGGPDGLGITLYEIETQTGDYSYFIGVGLFAAASLLLIFGYRNRLSIERSGAVQLKATIWGLPVRSPSIPGGKLEHVAVSVTHRGPFLQLISDAVLVRERLPSLTAARWAAWEIRSFLAEGVAEPGREISAPDEVRNPNAPAQAAGGLT